jgi:hypothetical protein
MSRPLNHGVLQSTDTNYYNCPSLRWCVLPAASIKSARVTDVPATPRGVFVANPLGAGRVLLRLGTLHGQDKLTPRSGADPEGALLDEAALRRQLRE